MNNTKRKNPADLSSTGFSFVVTVDNNDTVLYGCIRVALELQPSEENATLMKRVRQIGICRSQSTFGTVIYTLKTKNTLRSVLSFPRIVRYIYIHRTYTLALSARYALACVAFYS